MSYLLLSAHTPTLSFCLLQFGEPTLPPTKLSSTVTTNRIYINCSFTAVQKQLLKPRESTSFLTKKLHALKLFLRKEGPLHRSQQPALDPNLKKNESNGFTPEQATKAQGAVRLQFYSSFKLCSRRGWVDNARPRTLYPREGPRPVEQVAGQAQGPVWTGVENLAPNGIRSSDRPVRSGSPQRLRYPGPGLLLHLQ